MAGKKLSEGVGKKIVEALRKQSEIEITPIPNKKEEETIEIEENFEISEEITEPEMEEEIEEEVEMDVMEEASAMAEEISSIQQQPAYNYQQQMQTPIQTPIQQTQENFMTELDTFEIPNNIAVLKKLITQLPSGVTRHTGAQIIKQTMEALGISMKSVLQEAQQVQEGLNSSVTECHNNIQEYKKQIQVLEKQAQNYHRQYTALNELISLFVQTGL